MVVNVKGKAHFNEYKNNLFYQIPENRIKDVRLGVEYLAFFNLKKPFASWKLTVFNKHPQGLCIRNFSVIDQEAHTS